MGSTCRKKIRGEFVGYFFRRTFWKEVGKIIWNNRRPCIGQASPDLVLTTAEDCLLIRPLMMSGRILLRRRANKLPRRQSITYFYF